MIQIGFAGVALCGLGVLILAWKTEVGQIRREILGLGLVVIGLFMAGYALIGLIPPGS